MPILIGDLLINSNLEIYRSIESEYFLRFNLPPLAFSNFDSCLRSLPPSNSTGVLSPFLFGSLEKYSADENNRMNPSSPYAASKASAELLVNSYAVTYGIDTVITRCTNNYGPRQFPEKLIPKVIILAEQGKKIPVYGTGKNVRDWIHVDDHCDSITKVLLEGKSGSSYNISASNEVDNITIIKKILEIMDKSTDNIEFVNDRPGHDFRYSLDSTKTQKELKWSPKVSFDEGLEKTVKWYMNNKEWWKNISQETLVPKW